MRRTKRLKPILALLLILVMVLGLIPAQPAAAEDLISIVSEPYICCRVKVAKVTYGGTDSDMYCDVNFIDNSTTSFKMDKSSYNDFEQGDNDSYWFSIKKPVWMIKSYDVRINGSDGVCIEEIEIGINNGPNADNTSYHKVKKTLSGDSRWLESAGDEITLTPSLKRQLEDSSYNTFVGAFSKTVYLDANASTSATEVGWTPTCDYDGIFKSYNPFNYGDAPGLAIKVYTSGFGSNSWASANGEISNLFTTQNNGKGFTYTPSAVYAKMAEANQVGIRVDVSLTYPTRSSNGVTSKTVSYYIYRRQFGIDSGAIAVTSSYYTATTDNYFFNSDKRQVTIRIPLQQNVNYQQANILKVMAEEIKLYYGNETTFAVADGRIDRIGNDLYASFTLDSSFESPTSGSVGMKLRLKNLRFLLASDPLNPFYLYDKNTVGRAVTLGGISTTLGIGDYYQFFSAYKVDNVSPENKVSLREQGFSGNAAFSDAWHKQVTLLTGSTETIYLQGSSSPDDNAGYLTLTVGNGIKVRVGNSTTGVNSFTVPTMLGEESATTITLNDQAEYSDLWISVSGQDFAGNRFTKTYRGLKMDTLAPRVTLSRSNDAEQAVDGTRSAYFTFNITDASGTGRVNYCFVRDGQTLPAEGAGSEHSGVITELIGQWCFVSQSSSSTTAVLKLNDGESFSGTLHYYAVDDLGNRTATTAVPISVRNQKAECTYTVKTLSGQDFTYPQSAYSVVFTPGSDCEVYYRYKDKTAYTKYIPGTSVPGDTQAVTGSLLSGQQILEYKVHNTASDNEVVFEGDNGIILVFDNEAPQLTLTRASSGSSMAVQTFALNATDPSGIASARYEVLLGAEDTVVASGDLSVEEGTGVLSAGLSVGSDLGLGNGSYRLKLYAEDRNGQDSDTVSGTFSIRVQPPAVQVTAVNGAAPGDPTVTGSRNNTLTLTVADTFAGDQAGQTHNAYCRVSGDGSTYTDWILLGELTKGTGDALSLTADLNTFPELSEGTNQIYLQVICAESEKTLTASNISAASIFRLDPPVRVLLDLTAPIAQWSVTCGRNNTALTGDVTVSDSVTMYPTVTCGTTGVELTQDQGNGNRYHLVYNVPADGSVPDEILVYMTDEMGNTGVLRIADDLSLLDLEGPRITLSTVNTQLGDRVDAEVTVQLIDDNPGHIDVLFNEAEGSGRYSTVRDNHDGTYTVFLRGYNSTSASPFTVYAYDDLGNETSMEASPVTVIYPEFDLVGLFSQPAFAQESTPVGLEFNVPALAVPIYVEQSGSETLEEAADRAFQEAGSRLDSLAATTAYSTAASCELHYSVYSVTADAVAYELEKEYGSGWQSRLGEYGSGDWPCYVLAKDELGNSKVFLVRPDTQFEMVFPIDLIVEQYYDGQKIDVFPNNTIVAGTHAPDPSVDPDAAPAAYTAAVIIRAYNLRDANGNFYLRQSSGGVYTYVDQSGRVLTAEEFAAQAPGAEELDYALFPYTILTADDSRIADLQAPDAEDHDGKGTLFRFDRSSGDTIAIAAGDYGWAFAQLAFSVDAEANVAVDSSTISVGYVNHPGNAAGDPRTVYIRSFTDPGSGSTAEVELNPADIWLNQTLQTGPIVAIQPAITKSWQQSSMRAEVELNVTASGAGETRLIKVLMKTEDGWTVVDQWNGEGDGPNLNVTITEEGTYCVYAEDEYGLSALSEEFEITIQTDPITEDDFTIAMEAYDYGWAAVTDDSLPASEARFTVSIADSGAARGLAVKDPVGGVVTLTYDSPTYTLVLEDDYGYRYEKLLTYANLIPPPEPDVTAPAVEYSFTNENKTNQPYDVLIAVTDEESGVLSVTLTGSAGETIPLTEADGVWTGTISASGSYMITAEDKAGNAAKKIFSVINIDNSPVTAELEYSTRDLTQDIVTVTLNYNKRNVTVTRMERSSGYASMDERAGKVYFPENGTVTVWFKDEYGNEGAAVVTVNNIYDVPPQLKAIPVLADDGLSVSVTFEMEKDENGAPLDVYRKLSDLTVIQNGVSYDADEARYVLRNNGAYTFTVVDQVGLMQVIEVVLKDIDRDAPQVTSVSWTYVYLDADGNEKNISYDLNSIEGAGYRIAIDKYIRTNRDVTVTVTTDKPTSIIGSYDDTPVLSHQLVYRENGMYVYNLKKTNGLSVSYGVDVEIIDKTPPEIELENPNYLLFIEGRDSGSVRDMLTDYTARDEYLNTTTDLTGAVKVDFGGLDPDVLENNTFDKSKPFTVTYAVKDDAGNETVVTRTVVLVSINDVLVTVNGRLPSAASMLESETGDLKLELINFSGVAYATYAAGQRTFGQMKTMGTVLKQENGAFNIAGLERGWYTFFVQTEARDYFNIYVFVD